MKLECKAQNRSDEHLSETYEIDYRYAAIGKYFFPCDRNSERTRSYLKTQIQQGNRAATRKTLGWSTSGLTQISAAKRRPRGAWPSRPCRPTAGVLTDQVATRVSFTVETTVLPSFARQRAIRVPSGYSWFKDIRVGLAEGGTLET